MLEKYNDQIWCMNSTEDLDGGEYLFAFRMLMVLFRREFSFVDALYLWEVRKYFYTNLIPTIRACVILNVNR